MKAETCRHRGLFCVLIRSTRVFSFRRYRTTARSRLEEAFAIGKASPEHGCIRRSRISALPPEPPVEKWSSSQPRLRHGGWLSAAVYSSDHGRPGGTPLIGVPCYLPIRGSSSSGARSGHRVRRCPSGTCATKTVTHSLRPTVYTIAPTG